MKQSERKLSVIDPVERDQQYDPSPPLPSLPLEMAHVAGRTFED
jgi:hypothetical protein